MSVYSDYVISTNPENYWRLGETSGTIAYDEMGNHNGTYAGSYSRGYAGGIVNDPSTSILIKRSPESSVTTTLKPSATTITACGWYYPISDNTSVCQPIISCDRNCCGTYTGWGLYYVGNAGTRAESILWRNSATQSSVAPASPAMKTGEWLFLAMTYDGAIQRLFLNGLQIGSSSGAGKLIASPSSFNLKIGSMASQAGYTLGNGYLQDVAWWSTALTPMEISEMWRLGSESDPFVRFSQNNGLMF